MDAVIINLLASVPLAPLGPGEPLTAFSGQIARAIEKIPAQDVMMQKACESGLWLICGFLDKSHTLSQEIDTPTGAFWHGIMHRREPDASNAAYWFDRVGPHAVFPRIAAAVADLLRSEPEQIAQTEFQALAKKWDPFSFIGLCEKFRDSGEPGEWLCRKIQFAECRQLLEYSHGQAARV
ncbi:hypothetical protein QPK87_11290 [Kamptonema cortianum]|nr:hypothetical protein [Oscillatoria laete-virens]MDK3157158.1 hypothetical protein [Kamptonema cortianum]MDL5055040.1 hypothetical protein [Oscillatoria laete-virens NRMC-F 0139]